MQSTRTCTFPECDRKSRARGLCAGHWKQQSEGKRLAPLRLVAPSDADFRQRLEMFTDKGDGCWLYSGFVERGGYARISLRGVRKPVHRIAFELAFGEIPEGLVIDHKCHVRHCVNPEHLQAVTPKQNSENLAGASSRSSTGVRGVYWDARMHKYRVTVRHDGRNRFGGHFDRLEDADQAAIAFRNRLFTNNLRDRTETTSNETEQAA